MSDNKEIIGEVVSRELKAVPHYFIIHRYVYEGGLGRWVVWSDDKIDPRDREEIIKHYKHSYYQTRCSPYEWKLISVMLEE